MRFPAASVSGICKEDTSMKRILSLVLALVMVLGCVPVASAAVTKLPTTVDGYTSLPAKPTAPNYTLSTVGDHYELTVAEPDNYVTNGYIYMEGRTEDHNDSGVSFTWDEAKKIFVSDALLDDTYNKDVVIGFRDWVKNVSVDVNVNTNEVDYASGRNPETNEYIYWFDDGSTQVETKIGDNWTFATYNRNGNLSNYWYEAGEGYRPTFDAYGNLTSVNLQTIDENSIWHNLQWDFHTETWLEEVYDDELETWIWTEAEQEYPAYDASQHAALGTIEYSFEMPPVKFDATGDGFKIDDWGDPVYSGENVSAYYDENGNLNSYTITNEDGMLVSYDQYGRITWAYQYTGMGALTWDPNTNEWEYESWATDESYVEDSLAAFDATKYPAPYAKEYAIATPPASFVSGGEGFVSEEWGNYYYGENLSVNYNDSGAINSYTITTFDDYRISYDRYGRLQGVYTYDSKGNSIDWNQNTQQWEQYDWETETSTPVTGLDPFVASKFPAPYAEPYTVTLPPATLAADKIDTTKFVADELGEMKLGEDGIVSLADVDYFDATINYRDANGNYKYVNMTYDEATKTWISDAALPAGVALTDLNVNLIDENWKYTTYRKGALDSISIDNVVKEADGTYIRYDHENEYNVTGYYDAAGNLTSYFFNDFEQTMGVEYDMNGNLLYAWADAADGKTYYYYDAADPLKLDDGTIVTGWYYWDENDKRVLCNEPAGLELPEALINAKPKKADVIWYPYNTMCVAGISLKDTYGITDKWYNVVPVDLTKDGTQTFDLVASGMFLIGKANVTVADGNVTVTYGMPWGHGYIKEEVLNWFTSVDQITAEFCDAPTSAYAFGEPVSISEDLGGADVGLLFICNRVTYRQPYYNNGAHLVRWYCNKPEWKAFREQLMTIMPE